MLRKGAFIVVVCTCLLRPTGWADLDARPAQGPLAAPDEHRSTIQRYCITCHNERSQAQGLAFDGVDVSHPGESPEVWERVLRKLRTRAMPPQGMPRPEESTYKTHVTWRETELDRTARAQRSFDRDRIGLIHAAPERDDRVLHRRPEARALRPMSRRYCIPSKWIRDAAW